MATLTVSTHVSASLDNVFAVFTDIEKTEERIPAITRLDLLSEGPFGEGTRWRETRVIMKKEAIEEMWVTGFEPPHRYTVEAQSHGMLYQTLFEFEPEGDGTMVRWTFNSTPQTFGAKLTAPIFGLVFKGIMKKCMLGDLEALRDVCEGTAPGA
jgi:carbon monoxide dehydrogenase subunit G